MCPYGVDVWNCFAHLPSEPLIDDCQCADSAVMSDRPDISYEYSSFYLGSMPTSHDFHLTVYPFQELSAVIPFLISMPFPLPLRMESLCCPLLYSLYLP